jgi:iduronate 2-sulfatase
MGYSMRTDDHRYTEWRQMNTGQIVARELYDHTVDPAETENIAVTQQAVVSKLARQLRQVFPDRKWNPDDVAVPSAADN